MTEVETTYGGGLRLWVGPGSVATPGALAGLGLAHERYGVAPWPEVVAPAIEVARHGFPLGAAAGSYLELARDSRLRLGPRVRGGPAAPERRAGRRR